MINALSKPQICLIILLALPLLTVSADYPLEVRFSLIKQNAGMEEYSENYTPFRSQEVIDDLEPDNFIYNTIRSYGLEGTFGYKLNEAFRLNLTVGYDYLFLFQDDVLDKWDWDYWEDTYIEFIPGLNVNQVNRSLSYNEANDSSTFAATFAPQQRLKELRFSAGLEWVQPLVEKLKAVFRYDLGMSLYTRELRMNETWYKRYNIGVDTAFYEYSYDLLHFAPPKKGMKFFVAPAVGLRYELSRIFDLDLSFRYFGYTDLLDNREKNTFPLYSKYQFTTGIIIKY
jgi:hypothetical protein